MQNGMCGKLPVLRSGEYYAECGKLTYRRSDASSHGVQGWGGGRLGEGVSRCIDLTFVLIFFPLEHVCRSR